MQVKHVPQLAPRVRSRLSVGQPSATSEVSLLVRWHVLSPPLGPDKRVCRMFASVGTDLSSWRRAGHPHPHPAPRASSAGRVKAQRGLRQPVGKGGQREGHVEAVSRELGCQGEDQPTSTHLCPCTLATRRDSVGRKGKIALLRLHRNRDVTYPRARCPAGEEVGGRGRVLV